MAQTLRQTWVGLRILVVMTVLLGIVYPAAVFLVGRIAPSSSDGSWVVDGAGTVVGSRLVGQQFDGPAWFHSRPSAAGDGYDALASSGSNLAPDNPDLVDAVAERKSAVVVDDGATAGSVPADAVTASGSGLDPHISPEYADLQVARVAAARGISAAQVQALVDGHTAGRLLGFLGEPRVNVLELNLALAAMP